MRVLCPGTLAEALSMRAASPGAIPIAGGTDLLVHWPERWQEHRATFLDLSGVAELQAMRWSDDALILGAMTTFWDVVRDGTARAAYPSLASAARQVGAIQIQARGTWAGNIANGSPAADGVAALMAYDAVVELQSVNQTTDVPLTDFYSGYKDMRLAPDQLITAIRVPRADYDIHAFEKVGARRAQAITKVGVAATRAADGWRVVAASMAPTVRRCPAVEHRINDGGSLDDPAQLLEPMATDFTPIDDIRSTARYRTRVFANVLYHIVRHAAS